MTIQQAMEELNTPQYIGEDGETMCVNCKTKVGALRKFRQLAREEWTDEECKDLTLDMISQGWLYLSTDEDREEMGTDCDWLVSWNLEKANDYPVWVLNI